MRKGIKIVEGRMFSPGANEIVVGKALLREFEGFEIGKTVGFATSRGRWSACSRPTAACSSRKSGRICRWSRACSTAATSFRPCASRLQSPAALDALKRYVDDDPRLKLDVKSEAAYFAAQAAQTSDLIQMLGWPLAIAMALGALAGALNTMYSSVAARAVEIATLRAIGFGGFPGLRRHLGRNR